MAEPTRADAPAVERRSNRTEAVVTHQQVMTAVDELTSAARAWNGHGPEFTAKRDVVAALLRKAGLVS